MALVACKECGKFIYEQAEKCTNCDVTKPGYSYEEQRAEDAMEKAIKREEENAEKYMAIQNQNPISRFFNRHLLYKYIDLANAAREEKIRLRDQLAELHRKKERQ